MVPKKHPRSEQGRSGLTISSHKTLPKSLRGLERPLLLDQLLTLARVAIDLVQRQEKAEDPVYLDEAEIVALVLHDYGDRTLPGLKVHRAMLSQAGIELDFGTQHLGREVLWSLKLTRHKPGRSEASPWSEE